MPLRLHKKHLQDLLENYATFVSRSDYMDTHTRLVGASEHMAGIIKEVRRTRATIQRRKSNSHQLDDMELLEVVRRAIIKGFDDHLTLRFMVTSPKEELKETKDESQEEKPVTH